MKKLIAVLLSAALLLSLCACAATNPLTGKKSIKGLSATEAVNLANENMTKVKSYREEGNMKVGVSVSGFTLQIKLLQSLEYSSDPDAMHMKLTMDMGMLGSQEMEMYTVPENGKAVCYSYTDGSWVKFEDDALDSTEMMNIDASQATEYREIGKEEINGEKCVHYQGIVDSSKLGELLGESGVGSLFASMGIDLSDAEAGGELADLFGDLYLDIWISEKQSLPVRYQLDMSAMMQGLMDMMNSAASETELNADITDCIFELKFFDIDQVDTSTVPAEVLAEAGQ